ncbi:hypothetical protein [Pseudomonas sp. EL_65y_Pfl2_R96]|uniref:hypothetical protein n=1 Tax=Pseudomonas sp. EL_65y_Pfl2_R96 TaxID=3088699 RepID=UPI0030D8CB72
MQPQSEPLVMKAVFDQLKEANLDICKYINFINITATGRSAEVQKCRSRPRKPPQSAILFGSTPSGISQEDSESLFWVLQVLFSYHELMHAKDLKIEKNFNLPDRRVDLVKAEIYVNISTLRFLSSIRSPKRMYSETYMQPAYSAEPRLRFTLEYLTASQNHSPRLSSKHWLQTAFYRSRRNNKTVKPIQAIDVSTT